MSEPELKPCPWCGKPMHMYQYPEGVEYRTFMCKGPKPGCPHMTTHIAAKTDAAAIAAWNSWGEKDE